MFWFFLLLWRSDGNMLKLSWYNMIIKMSVYGRQNISKGTFSMKKGASLKFSKFKSLHLKRHLEPMHHLSYRTVLKKEPKMEQQIKTQTNVSYIEKTLFHGLEAKQDFWALGKYKRCASAGRLLRKAKNAPLPRRKVITWEIPFVTRTQTHNSQLSHWILNQILDFAL